jgi:hypothetical protein
MRMDIRFIFRCDEFVVKKNNIDMVVKIVRKNKAQTDFAFWQAQPFEKRLAALEQIRSEVHNGTKQRLQRVYKIVR